MQRATTNSEVFYVSPVPTGGWAVFGSDIAPPLSTFALRGSALEHARIRAQQVALVRCRSSTGMGPWKNFSSTRRRATADLRAGELFRRPLSSRHGFVTRAPHADFPR